MLIIFLNSLVYYFPADSQLRVLSQDSSQLILQDQPIKQTNKQKKKNVTLTFRK